MAIQQQRTPPVLLFSFLPAGKGFKQLKVSLLMERKKLNNSLNSFLARHEIDQNDDELKIITASLTRAQANAVRRRIDSLNEAIRQRNSGDQSNSSSYKSSKSSRSKQRRHVKDIFQNSDSSTPPTSKRM